MQTTACTHASPAPTMAQLEALADKIAEVGRDPLADWMRSQGFDPDHGCLLTLPATLRAAVGPCPPSYVRFKDAITAPYLVRNVFICRP